MRQALFAVMLVAASFAGGAVVNGPGLRWAQEQITHRFNLDVEEEPTESRPQIVAANPTDSTESEFPSRPIPPLAVEPTETRSDRSLTPRTGQGDRIEAPAVAMAGASSTPPEKTPLATPEAEGVSLPPLTTAETLPLDRPEPQASPGDPEPPRPKSSTGPKSMADAAMALASLAGKAVAGKTGEGEGEGAAPPAPKPEAPSLSEPGDPTDWPGVRKSLQALGVTRYGIDGEPDGRVRFHCVIPLAGRRAVSQYFEAEGPDEFQAARSALRRVTLWKATEGVDEAP
ncbi:MAG: hypothetical protein AB7I30_16675 [Isosphaeraceae bacterium]